MIIIDIFKEVKMFKGILETLYMVITSTVIAYILGFIIGTFTLVTEKDGLKPNKIINSILNIFINVGRSIPFMILSIILIPLTRFIVGSSWGNSASIVSLSVCAMFFVSRVVYLSLKEVDKTIIEAFVCMGATNYQIVKNVYLKESLPSLIRGVSLTLINLIGYSAMLGAIGAGGLGNIAMIYGYQKFRTDVMIVTTILIIILVQLTQFVFDKISLKIDKK